MELDRERILELLKQLQASSAAELTVREGDTRIRLVRGVAPVLLPAGAGPGVATVLDEVATEAVASVVAAPLPPPVEPSTTVCSRVVGLFYRGKEPGGKPLVEVGQAVVEGQPLAIVEVLRKPTEVTSPVPGTIAAVLAEDGAGVQYGDALFTIDA